MEIVKELNLNKTPQSVKNNSLVCAKNIKVSTDGQYITNDDGIEEVFRLDDDSAKLVGVISCNTELVIFVHNGDGSDSIYRYNEINKIKTLVPNGWKWSGGVVKGTYTYNINNELIVAVAESEIENKDIPLKTINLNTSKVDDYDYFYNSAPNIPVSNLFFYGYTLGNGIVQGTYQFFIRYTIDNSSKTKWFPCSIPIIATNIDPSIIINNIWKDNNLSGMDYVSIDCNSEGTCNLDFDFELVVKGNNYYSECELAYTIKRDSAIFGRKWRTIKLNPKIEKDTIAIKFDKNSNIELAVDDLVDNAFNLYDVKNICNYNNRLYISNYKELEINKNLEELSKKIKARCGWRNINKASGEGHIVNDIKGRMKFRTLIPNQVYNFFIHYVNPDGTNTAGYRLTNNDNVRLDVNGHEFLVYNNLNTIDISNLPDYITKLKVNFGEYPIYTIINNATYHDSSTYNFGYYRNLDGDVFFRAPDYRDADRIFYPKFYNITVPKGYIGYFISYEEVEDIVKLTGLNTVYNSYFGERQYYLRLVSNEAITLNIEYGGLLYYTYKMVDIFGNRVSSIYKDDIIGLKSETSKVLSADSVIDDNQGREAGFYFELNNDIEIQFDNSTNDFPKFTRVGAIIAINNSIYSNNDKKLISIGEVVYSDPNVQSEDQDYGYGNSANVRNLDGYIARDANIVYDKRGIIINEEGIPTTLNKASVTKSINNYYILKYSKYFLDACNIKTAPKVVVNVSAGSSRVNRILYPVDSSDLFEYKNHFISDSLKYYYKFDPTKTYTSIFNKTIRRSDIIMSESLDNGWRNFRQDGYKYISENKGNITNIVGVGVYLLVHTEHSLFMFNRDASLKTKNKDVQLTIPDAFDTEYQEVFTSDKGYGGLQDSNAWCVNEYGYTFFDNSIKRLYSFDDGKLNILSLDVAEFLNSININKVVLANDIQNNRLLVSIKSIIDNEESYTTLSYNYITKTWISLHDYAFKAAYNTKENVYLLPVNNVNKIYKFSKAKDSKIGDFKDLKIIGASLFPEYESVDANSKYSYVDIIFNESFEIPKVLNYIDYILSELITYDSGDCQAETSNDSKYSGYKLFIYTDCTKTKTIDIDNKNLKNIFNNYKYPYFDKGKWNFNYFRNDVENNKSDYQSLIYGKYIVARFIFNTENNKRIKFENINFNVEKY